MDSLSFKAVDFAIQLAVILFAISFHESAHAYAALRFGDTTARDLGRISLNPIRHLDPFGSVLFPLLIYFGSGGRFIFGSAKPTPVNLANTRNPRLANLVVSAAGPASNLVLGAISLSLLLVIKRSDPRSIVDLFLATEGQRFAPGALAPINYVLYIFTLVNVFLALFNLIPIPPLDGSGVVLSVFGASIARFYTIIAPLGFLLLLGLLYLGVLNWIFGPAYVILRTIIFSGLGQ